jgi:pimeloyl-ACP methyl ester carboxylesterase
MMGAATAHYQCVKVLSETEFYDDLKMIDIPVLVMHGEDDQICPFPTTGARSVKLLKHGMLSPTLVSRTVCRPPMRIKSTPTSSHSSSRKENRPVSLKALYFALTGRALQSSHSSRS